jgi:hypothetical protein
MSLGIREFERGATVSEVTLASPVLVGVAAPVWPEAIRYGNGLDLREYQTLTSDLLLKWDVVGSEGCRSNGDHVHFRGRQHGNGAEHRDGALARRGFGWLRAFR